MSIVETFCILIEKGLNSVLLSRVCLKMLVIELCFGNNVYFDYEHDFMYIEMSVTHVMHDDYVYEMWMKRCNGTYK